MIKNANEIFQNNEKYTTKLKFNFRFKKKKRDFDAFGNVNFTDIYW